jgi:hypothetical protein
VITLQGDGRDVRTPDAPWEECPSGEIVISKRARLNRIFAVIFILWGGGIAISGIVRGLPSGSTAYGAGQLTAFGFGFVMVAVGVWTLVGLRKRFAASSSDGYDDHDDVSESPGRRAPWVLVGVVSIVVIALVAAVGLWNPRVSRADELAVKYGAASATDDASLADRCTGLIREDYDRSSDPGKAGLPPQAFALLAPKVCALGVERGLVQSDGTMSVQAGKDLTLEVIEGMGADRFQTLVFDELAVAYDLAEPGKATRWDRCVAMGYSGWDAQPTKAGLPPRERFFRAMREVCTVGIKRGIVPPSGAPVINSPEDAAMQQLLTAALLNPAR